MTARGPKTVDVQLLEIAGEELAILSFPAIAAGTMVSSAEREILRLLANGMSNAAIAAERKTSARTVANQIAALLRKFGVSSRYELVLAATTLQADS